jgi:hypothetical protein
MKIDFCEDDDDKNEQLAEKDQVISNLNKLIEFQLAQIKGKKKRKKEKKVKITRLRSNNT